MKSTLYVFLSLFLFFALVKSECGSLNNGTGLYYNLTMMTRSLSETDYYFRNNSQSGIYTTYFINICANAKEVCTPKNGACIENLEQYPYTYYSYGESTDYTFAPYVPNPSADGITLIYSGGSTCSTGATRTTYINILCDNTVATGVIDSAGTDTENCNAIVNMRSIYACGYAPDEEPECFVTVVEPICEYSGKSNFECQSGDFYIAVTGNENVPMFTFWMEEDEYTYSSEVEASQNETVPDYDDDAAYDDADLDDDTYVDPIPTLLSQIQTTFFPWVPVKIVEQVETEEDDDDAAYYSQYKIQFKQLWEATVDGDKVKKVPGSELSLASLTWNFTTPVVITDSDCAQETTFNITNIDTSRSRWTAFSLVNHLSMNADNTSSLKFDVLIEEYQWVSSDPSTYLVLIFQLDGPSNSNVSSDDSSVIVGEAYFNISSTALAFPNPNDPGDNYTVTATVDYQGGNIELFYSHFDGSLVHDPTIGIFTPPLPIISSTNCLDNTCSIGDFEVNVVDSEIPTYNFGVTSSTYQYNVQFLSLAEAVVTETGDLSISSVIHSSEVAWTVSTPVAGYTANNVPETVFNISTGALGNRWTSITLINHLILNQNISHLKFDVIVENYQWVDTSNTNKLLLSFGFQGYGSIGASHSMVTVGDAYFDISTTANAYYSLADKSGVQIVNVGMNYDSTSNIQVVYSHFQGSLVHDPSVGVMTENDSPNVPPSLEIVENPPVADDNSYLWLWITLAVGITVGVALVSVFAGVIIYKRKIHTNYVTVA